MSSGSGKKSAGAVKVKPCSSRLILFGLNLIHFALSP
jgi:hypothetical protein